MQDAPISMLEEFSQLKDPWVDRMNRRKPTDMNP